MNNKSVLPDIGETTPDAARESVISEKELMFRVVREFVDSIESLRSSIGHVLLGLQASERNAAKKMSIYAEKYGDVVESRDQSLGRKFRFHPPYDTKAGRLNRRIRRAESAVQLLPRVYLLALVSQFDAFMGQLLRTVFRLKPQLLSGIEHTVTFESLTAAGSVEVLADQILDKQIESLLRKSRTEQFDWLEKKFNLELRKGLESWARLIESTERRNLYAHSDGRVSEQYLSVCAKHGVTLTSDVSKDTRLDVTPEYFADACACHLEIGLKLSQVLWRKVRPDQIIDADKALSAITVDLIIDEHIEVAQKVLDFAVSPSFKRSTEELRRMHVINRAQAYKWAGENQKCQDIIATEDWSATDAKFRLSVEVLKDNFQEAKKWMIQIGTEGEVGRNDYQEWPLFREFRSSEEFLEAYKIVFGEQFVHVEEALAAYEEEHRRREFESLKRFIDEELGDDAVENGTEHVSEDLRGTNGK